MLASPMSLMPTTEKIIVNDTLYIFINNNLTGLIGIHGKACHKSTGYILGDEVGSHVAPITLSWFSGFRSLPVALGTC